MLTEEVVRKLSFTLEEPEWLLKKRIESLKTFNQLEMPSFKYGIGIFVDISELDINSINPLSRSNNSVAVFSDEVEVFTFQEAIKKHENIIKEYFMTKCVIPNENKFTALHGAFFNSTILIIIPENKILEKPINIILNLDSQASFDHVLIIAGKNSKATIIESSRSRNNVKSFRSQVVEAIVRENASIEYVSVQNFNNSVYNFSKRNAHVESNGFMFWLDCGIGSKFSQVITSTNLIGIGAGSKSNGIIFGDETQCFDINSETIHSASKTTCDMMTRVVLNGKAKAVYRGLVKINPKAVNCEGYQKDDTILLSDDARADVVPNLEIKNNDVKCSHGATISQIDEDKLFYMMSRGIDDKTAKKTIVEGFFDPLMIKIENPELKNEIMNSISKRLGTLR